MKRAITAITTIAALFISSFTFSACDLGELFSGSSENEQNQQQSNNSNNQNGDNIIYEDNHEDNEDNQNAGNQPQQPVIIEVEPITLTVRTESATITDSGRASQKLDVVNLSNYYNISALKNSGFTYLTVSLSLDVKEVDDGYQYVFLYYNSSCKGNSVWDKVEDFVVGSDDDPSLLYTYKFEHGPGEKDTSWSTHSFTTTIPLDDITANLYIRYGASGKGDDNWINKNVIITVKPVKPA